MKRDALLALLEELARRHEIEIRRGKFEGKSGLGKYKGKWILLMDRSLEPRERVELLTDALVEAGVPGDELPVEVRTLLNRGHA